VAHLSQEQRRKNVRPLAVLMILLLTVSKPNRFIYTVSIVTISDIPIHHICDDGSRVFQMLMYACAVQVCNRRPHHLSRLRSRSTDPRCQMRAYCGGVIRLRFASFVSFSQMPLMSERCILHAIVGEHFRFLFNAVRDLRPMPTAAW
jgi:hypothetical protein